MKKIFGFILLIVLFVACESEDGEWDKLSQQDQDYVRNRATQECLAEEGPVFENFRSQSELFFGSASYPREKSYTSKLNDSGNNAIEERLIRIWKNTASYIIFYIEETVGTTTTKYFIQIVKNDTDSDYANDTIAYNDSMIDSLKHAYCARVVEYVSGDSGPATIYKTTSTGLSAGGRRETKVTQVYNFSEIAYFPYFRRSLTIKDYDTEDTVTVTKSYTSTFVENASPPVLTLDYTTLTSTLCYIDPASYNLPYSLKCDGTYAADMAP